MLVKIDMFFKNRYFWIAAVISLALDRLTKVWVVTSLDPTNPPELPFIPGFLHITYIYNDAAAFGLFREFGGALVWLSLGVSAGLMALAWFGPAQNRWEQFGYGFILGGALGNGIDRFTTGLVVDFLAFSFVRFPVFNLADVFINVGIVCLLIASFRKSDPENVDSNPSKKHL